MERRLKFLFLISATAILFWLPSPRAGRGRAWPSLAAPASASIVLDSSYTRKSYNDEDTAVTRLLRAHGKLVFALIPILMGLIYIFIFGPNEVADALNHLPRRGRGFMTPPGGFGGISTNLKNPWE